MNTDNFDKTIRAYEASGKKESKTSKKGSLLVDNAFSKDKSYLSECTDEDLKNIETLVSNPSLLDNFKETEGYGKLLLPQDKSLFVKKVLKPICYPKEISIEPSSSKENELCFSDSHCNKGLVCNNNFDDYLPGKCELEDPSILKLDITTSQSCKTSDDCNIGYRCKEEKGLFTSSSKCIKENIPTKLDDLLLYSLVQ